MGEKKSDFENFEPYNIEIHRIKKKWFLDFPEKWIRVTSGANGTRK